MARATAVKLPPGRLIVVPALSITLPPCANNVLPVPAVI